MWMRWKDWTACEWGVEMGFWCGWNMENRLHVYRYSNLLLLSPGHHDLHIWRTTGENKVRLQQNLHAIMTYLPSVSCCIALVSYLYFDWYHYLTYCCHHHHYWLSLFVINYWLSLFLIISSSIRSDYSFVDLFFHPISMTWTAETSTWRRQMTVVQLSTAVCTHILDSA